MMKFMKNGLNPSGKRTEGADAGSGSTGPASEADQAENRRRNLKLAFLAIVGIFLVVVAIILRTVLTPVLISLVLAYVADPLLGWCERHRIRRWVATTLLYIVCIGLIGFLTAALGPRIVNQTQRLYRYVSGVAMNYGSAVLESGSEGAPGGSPDAESGEAADRGQEVPGTGNNGAQQSLSGEKTGGILWKLGIPVPEWKMRARNYVQSHADEIATKIAAVAVAVWQNAIKGLSSAAGFVFGLVLVLVYTFFFMLHFRDMTSTVKRHIPAAHRERTLRILGRIDSAVSNFFRGRLLVCLIAGVVYVIGLRISGIDFWLLIGLAGGILGFIPFIGVILPIIPACAFALLTGHPWGSLIGVLVTFSIVQWIVEPLAGTMILSHNVKMHPVTILLALLVGAYLFGMFGVLLSVPLAAVVKILSEEFILPPLRELAAEDGSGNP